MFRCRRKVEKLGGPQIWGSRIRIRIRFDSILFDSASIWIRIRIRYDSDFIRFGIGFEFIFDSIRIRIRIRIRFDSIWIRFDTDSIQFGFGFVFDSIRIRFGFDFSLLAVAYRFSHLFQNRES